MALNLSRLPGDCVRALDGSLSLGFGVHEVGRYSSDGTALRARVSKDAVKKAVKKRAA